MLLELTRVGDDPESQPAVGGKDGVAKNGACQNPNAKKPTASMRSSAR